MAKSKNFKKQIAIILAFIGVGIVGLTLGINLPKIQAKIKDYQATKQKAKDEARVKTLNEMVIPKDGFTLPISWGDLGPKLSEAGVIDQKKFEEAARLTDDQKQILEKGGDIPVKINSQNGQFVVDLLWAIGLAQKSIIYTEGPLGTQYKGQEGTFASTGGWTLAKGDAVKYLNRFDLIPLTPDQQKRVADISKNIYRPCCDNPTWFPDCNHGMAALAAIEMMVSKNIPDDEIYKNVLKLNSFWFPDTYLTIAVYFDRQGTSWNKIDARKVLNKDFSSATGASRVQSLVGPLPGQNSGGSCGA